MSGKVYIVGGGPGDPGLITVKGLKVLRQADVVLYDRLISPELLREIRNGAELIYVGKERGEAEIQEEINALLLKKARMGLTVVRLKGGDPYVFGRGEEECLFLIERGVECEVIPGVTSAIAGPAYAGIPVTSRWYSSGFSVVTGQRADGSAMDLDYIPKKGTVVLLMGVSRVEEVAKNLMKVRSERTPVAVIEKATTEGQRVLTCTLRELAKTVREHNVTSPALIVVGEVVELRNKLWKFK